ncbi:MAG: hypothetical protein ABW072_06200 [Sedimenticola sp.]
MEKPTLTRSAALHLRISAFGALFVIFVASFEPMTAFIMALFATAFLAMV